MRQAGRYLPEYRAMRRKHSLLSCFHEPDLAEQITLMPLNRFGLDAAILFSDLLVLVEVWGKTVAYPEGSAPCILPSLKSVDELFIPTEEQIKEKLSYVFHTIALLKTRLDVPLIGFCGAPFTLLCYLLKGDGGRDFSEVRAWIQRRREGLISLLDVIGKTCISYAKLQIQEGVQAFQVFDSWADLLSKEEFSSYVLPYWKQMQEALEPLGVPLIFFSRVNSRFPKEIASISPHCVSFDEGAPLFALRKEIPPHISIQGNFSPTLLEKGSIAQVKEAAFQMVHPLMQESGIIWNLGHGVLPETPIKNVEALLEVLRSPLG
jgi:uroporphyrinogen decarboxylase